MDYVNTLLPIVVGALVAGISAVVKDAYERRDARQKGRQALELAAARTDFVKNWLEVSTSLDDATARTARARAGKELERAYEEARRAFDHNQQLLEKQTSTTVSRQLRSLLLLDRQRRGVTYVAVAAFYVLVAFMWLPVTIAETPEDVDYTPLWEDLVVAGVSTIVLRVIFGLLVQWLERPRTDAPDGRPDAPLEAPTPGVPTGEAAV